MSEVVYFIQIDGKDGPVKIGVTKDIDRRVNTISGSVPYSIRLLGVIEGGRRLEWSLHQRFSKYHIKNEWFRPVEEILQLIDNHTNVPNDERDADDREPEWEEVVILEPRIQELYIESTKLSSEEFTNAETDVEVFNRRFADKFSQLIGYQSNHINPTLIASVTWIMCRRRILDGIGLARQQIDLISRKEGILDAV